MSARVSVDRDADGRLLAVKQALDRQARPALVHEAAVLALARHPGVVESRGIREVDGTLQLMTTWVGSRSLADHPSRPAEQIAGIVAAVAETVADLHDLGVIHGQLADPSHVLFDQSGRPVLCGFGRAEIMATSPTRGAGRADDVRDLGVLLTGLVELDPGAQLVPIRRLGRSRRHEDDVARALLTLADHASSEDPTCRPTARALARALQQLAPGHHQPASPPLPAPTPPTATAGVDPLERLRAGAPTPASGRDRARILRAATAVAAMSGVAALALGVFSEGSASPPSATVPDVDTPAPDPDTTTSSHPASPDRQRSAEGAASGPPVVTVGGRRFEVGSPGDEVLVGDWACDGQLRAALVRPGTGEVFIFDGWAEAGADLEARPLANLEPGAHLRAVADGSCERLVGVLTDGQTIPLPPVAR